MSKQKKSLVGLVADIGKGASSLWNETREGIVKTMDQNDDGALDYKDITAAVESVGNAVSDAAETVGSAAVTAGNTVGKAMSTAGSAVGTAAVTAGNAVGKAVVDVGNTIGNAAASIKESIEAKNRENERKQFMPFFAEDLQKADFSMPKVIRLTGMDKRHENSEVCKGSVGHFFVSSDMKILNIYWDKTDVFPIEFFPNADSEVYFVDPQKSGLYIASEEYFKYLKNARINELQKLAQELGAKHFRILYKEKKSSDADKAVRAKASAKVSKIGTMNAEGSYDSSAKETSSAEVAAECSFPGSSPRMPHLLYLNHEPSIQNLIAMRMDVDSPITHQRISLKMSDSSGIKEKEAGKIDAALKAMKVSMSASVASAIKKEESTYLEYEIQF